MSIASMATNGDVRLAYEQRGTGDPLLLIHGLGYDRYGWGPLPDLLASQFDVTLFDNRGVGESDTPPGPYSASMLAGDALAVLDAAGIEEAHIVGTSLGGIVAQELVLANPGRVRRLVLACTTPGGTYAFPYPERTLRAFAEFASLPLEDALRRFVENALADETVATRPELVEEIYAYRLAHRPLPEAWQAQGAASLRFDSWHRLPEIRVPTLVLTGTADNVVDYRNSKLIAERIPGARLEHFDGLGHLFFWEEPERFARTVSEFLAA
jgi:pimeloyl-ACP methyl ester carboxylesterase